MRRRNQREQGFSLIELLIVVAIIGIIAAIAIPNLLASRKAANESSAVSSMRTISTAQQTYRLAYGGGTTFADTLANLHNNGLIIDNVLSSGHKSGYDLTLTTASPFTSFTAQAAPTTPGLSGDRYFFADETGTLRFNRTSPAGPTDMPIQ